MLYYRRKILLALLELFDGKLSAIQLQKYLFLFTERQYVKTFDFLPYKYGCFSFQANQDVMTLNTYRYIDVTRIDDIQTICLKEKGNYLQMLDMFDQVEMLNIKKRFGNMSQDDVIRYIYINYPYFAINSTIADKLLNEKELEIISKQIHHYNNPQLFAIGYEGFSLELYINKLIKNDVHVLCDVRKNAYSQKYGFSKKQLETACNGVGIKYVHVPQLGIESNKRKELHSQQDYDLLFDEYEHTTLKNNNETLLYVRSIIDTDKRVALTCFEKDPKQCHRSRVAKALLSMPDTNYSLENIL